MRDNEQLKIELLSQWKLEAESRNFPNGTFENMETLNLHRFWPWFQPCVKPKESEGRLKTYLETNFYDNSVFENQ